ncbi:aBC-type metal ion transporter periplasmic subunit [Clostridium sp. CAG:1193]|nr:aBC-type metal ion transporter periplasmic subunit [Clostridium sp. CAG:1193]
MIRYLKGMRMKKIFKLFMCLVMIISVFITSGCKKDSMEGITIYSTVYPIEYITETLYGDYSDVYSIYPNEVIELTDKLIADYSNSNLFVYNGLSNEKDYAVKMLNKNKNLRIVDATMGMEVLYSDPELWLNPSNFLMLCLNIRNGMKEYITNSFLRKEIDSNYDKLKLEISELDAEIKLLIENADSKTILVSNNVFKFFEKYGLEVISVFNDENLTDKTISLVKDAINDEKVKHIIMFENDTLTDEVEKIISDNNIEKIYFDSLTTLSSENQTSGKDYLSVMNSNLEILKKELYKSE